MLKIHTKVYAFLCALLMIPFISMAQTGSISGKVTDEKNETLPGASIAVKELGKGTITSPNGNYKLTGLPNGEYTVLVTYIGYQIAQRTITINGATTADFKLEPSAQALENVVINVGYGTTQRKDVTGSITTVSSKNFQKGVVATPEQLIAGKAAGVSIISNSGAPGAGSTIRIRGGASLNSSNDPLIVVDGVPLSNNSISGASNPLSLINPNDIETFTVLKDASAAAIYGSRASNGVILITTKKGTTGAPQVNFSSQFSSANTSKLVDVFSADEYRKFVTENGTPAEIAKLGNASTDWQKEIYQTALASDNNLSISGTYKILPYRVSLGYLNQNGILKTDNLQRTSGSVNLSPKFFDNHLKVNLNLKGALNKSRFANDRAIGAAISMNPTFPVNSGNDQYGGYYEYLASGGAPEVLAPRNPVALLEFRDNRSNVQRFIGNAHLDYSFHFLPELHAHLNLGYDNSEGKGTIKVPDFAAQSFPGTADANKVLQRGENNKYQQTQNNQLTEFYLSYGKDLKSISSRLDLVAGYGYQAVKVKDFSFPNIAANNAEISVPNFPFNILENRLTSYYGRLNYGYKNRYLLTATIRTDGSSRFAAENRWGTFPSAALAWNIKEESFLKSAKALSSLKLRIGYGVTGQQEGINRYDYISYYNLSDNAARYELGGNYYNMFRPGGYYPQRRWEQTATTNFAVDYGFANNRINGSLEYYVRDTKDLLNQVSQPAGTNFANEIVANIGSMKNKGVEFTITANAIQKKDVTWDLGFNITYNQNEITQLTIAPDPNYPGARLGNITGGTGNSVLIHSVNNPRGSFYVFQQVYNEQGKPLDGVFVDQNEDGAINEKDLYRFKSLDPKLFFGLTNSFNYKN